MNHRVIYEGMELSKSFVDEKVKEIIKLMESFDINPYEIIVCRSERNIDTYFQLLACKKMNITPLFISKEYSLRVIKGLVSKIKVRGILNSIKSKHTFEAISIKSYRNIDVKNAVIHMTSATSGNPKFVVRTEQQICNEIERYSKFLDISDKDNIFPIVPFSHSFGFISGMIMSIKNDAGLIITDTLLPRRIIELCNQGQATVMLGIPFLFKKMIDVDKKYVLNDRVRYVISSGSPMEEHLQRRFKERFNIKLMQQYGSTETGSLCVGYSNTNHRNVGRIIPGVVFNIIKNEEGKNHIYVSSPDTIGNYVTERGIEIIDSKMYKTGDEGFVNNQNELEIIGRVDSILIINGKKIDKKNIEDALLSMENINDVQIYITDRNGCKEISCNYLSEKKINKDLLIKYCSDRLLENQVPKNFYWKDKSEWKVKSWKMNGG